MNLEIDFRSGIPIYLQVVERIKERYRAWEDAGVTTMLVQARQPQALELMAEITGAARGATA